MPIRQRIIAIIVALLFVVLGIFLLVQRIGDVIGWDDISGGWWVMAIVSLLILFVAFLIYCMVSSRLDR